MNILAPLKALIIDDSEISLMVIEEMLGDYNIIPYTAGSGFASIRLAEHMVFDIVFVDYVMPGLNGVDTCVKLRSLGGRYERIPIVLMSGNTEFEEDIKSAGISDMLSKPLVPEKLRRLIDKWLGTDAHKPLNSTDACNKPEWFDRLSCIENLDTAKGVSLLGGKYDVYRKLLNAFCFQTEQKRPLMDGYITEKQMGDYAIEAHSFKSSLFNIGALALADKAKLLESYAHSKKHLLVAREHGEFFREIRLLSSRIHKALLSESAGEDNRPIYGKNELVSELQRALAAMNDFETGDAAVIIQELLKKRLPDEFAERIQSLDTLMDAYEFELFISNASSLLEELQDGDTYV